MKTPALVIPFCLAGCVAATAPGGGNLSPSDFGTAPSDPEQVIASFLRGHFKDPGSAQVERLGGPTIITMKGSILGPPTYGWGLCFRANGKNSYGAYSGYTTYALIWRDGSIQRTFGTMRGNSLDAGMAEAACNQIAK